MLMMRDDDCNDYGDDDDGRGKCFGVGRAAGESLNMFFKIDFFMTLLQLSQTYKTTCISHQIGNNFPFVYYILSFMVLRKVVQDSRSNSIINLR